MAEAAVDPLRISHPSPMERWDLLQEAALAIWRAGVKDVPLLVTIGRRAAIDALRVAHGRTERNLAKRGAKRFELKHSPLVEPDAQSNYWRAAEKLPEQECRAILLSCIFGKRTEAARHMGIKYHRLVYFWNQGMGRLRKAIREEG